MILSLICCLFIKNNQRVRRQIVVSGSKRTDPRLSCSKFRLSLGLTMGGGEKPNSEHTWKQSE